MPHRVNVWVMAAVGAVIRTQPGCGPSPLTIASSPLSHRCHCCAARTEDVDDGNEIASLAAEPVNGHTGASVARNGWSGLGESMDCARKGRDMDLSASLSVARLTS